MTEFQEFSKKTLQKALVEESEKETGFHSKTIKF